jgi:hypothetical protein
MNVYITLLAGFLQPIIDVLVELFESLGLPSNIAKLASAIIMLVVLFVLYLKLIDGFGIDV